MKKKAGILTFHNANNYGAALQAYALQTAINGLSPETETEIIDYTCNGIQGQRSLKRVIKKQGFVSAVLHWPFTKKRIKKIDEFCRKHMRLSRRVQSREELKALAEEYDVIISGSDQIWNRKWNGNDDVYLQDFHDHSEKKASYAASFGIKELPQEWKEPYRKYLSAFSAVSVREDSGKMIMKDDFDIDAQVNIDPTLLLTSSQWNSIAAPTIIDKPYVLVYMVPFQKSVLEYARKIAVQRGLEMVIVCKSLKKTGGIFMGGSAVEEIIALFRDAQCVVTNSFHGTAFSVIYNKELSIELKNPRGYNLRSKNLLRECGLLDGSEDEGEGILKISCPDAAKTEKRLAEKRKASFEYLAALLK